LYYLFTYEDSRDQFSIPYDIDILEQVFRVRAEGESDRALQDRALYNKSNKFFTAKSIQDLVNEIQNKDEEQHWKVEVDRVKALYNVLGEEYQRNKNKGIETSSTWR
jgi:hypothetical protein